MNNAQSGRRRYILRVLGLAGLLLAGFASCSLFEYPQPLNNPADPDLNYRYVGELNNRLGPDFYGGVPRPRDAEWHAATQQLFFVSDLTSRLYAQGLSDDAPVSVALPRELEIDADIALWNNGPDLHVFVSAGQVLLRAVISGGEQLQNAVISEVNLGSDWDAEIFGIETLNDSGDLYLAFFSDDGPGILQYDPEADDVLISRLIPDMNDSVSGNRGGFAVTDNYLAVSRSANGILRISRAGFSSGGDYDPWTFTEFGGTVSAAAGSGGASGWEGALDHLPGTPDTIVALRDSGTFGPAAVINLANTVSPLVSAPGTLGSYQFVESVPVAARTTGDYLVADSFGRVVRDLSSDTVEISWPDPDAGAFAGPLLITSDELGTVFIYDNFLGSVVRIDPNGVRTRVLPLGSLGIVSTISAREGRFALYEESGIDEVRLYNYVGATLETWTPPDLLNRRVAVAPLEPGLPEAYWMSADSSTAELTPLQSGGSLGTTVPLQTDGADLNVGALAVIAGETSEVYVGLSAFLGDSRESGVFLANFTDGSLTPVLGSLAGGEGVRELDPEEPPDSADVQALAYRSGFLWALIAEFAAAVRLTPQGDIRGSMSVGKDTSGLGTWTNPGTVINRRDYLEGSLAIDGSANLLFADRFEPYIQVFEAY